MKLPFLGHGVGLRVPHYERALAGGLDVDWVEVISENFFGGGGRPRAVLERLRRDLPLVLHGVSLGIGSAGVPAARYLSQLAELCERFEPAWLSDHLCWGHWQGQFSHDLLPLPYTEEALRHVVENVQRVQERLRRPILLENVSSYVAYAHSQLPEWEFLAEVAQRSGCLILLDLNNILVSAHNHGFSPQRYLEGIPAERVQQLHLANHSSLPTHKFDDHRGPVPTAVWELYQAVWQRWGPVSSCVEWDEEVPSWDVLRAEQQRAAALVSQLDAAHLVELSSVAARPQPEPEQASSAPPLAETQALFFRAITWPTGVQSFLEQTDAGTRQQFAASFTSSPGLDAVARLDIYANSYFYRLLGALRELFPRLCFLCGDAPFHNLVTDYVLARPSREPDLRKLGEPLPEFVGQHALGQSQPLLVEAAALDRASSSALDAPEGPRLEASELGRVPPERWPYLRLRFSPPTQLLSTRWDQQALERCRAQEQRSQALELPPGAARTALVGRRGHATYFRYPEPAEARALQRLWAGESFGVACEALAGEGVQPEQVVRALQRWLADGMLAAASWDEPDLA